MTEMIALRVDAHHPAFRGHFPGRPIVPGVLLLEWAVDAIADAEAARGEKFNLLPGKVAVAKFLSPVLPGENLQLHYRRDDSAIFHLEIRCGERKIATATIASATADIGSEHARE